MTHISFTSGEIQDIMSALVDRETEAHNTGNPHLAAYYLNIAQQFALILDKLDEFVPENRVANLVLAVN